MALDPQAIQQMLQQRQAGFQPSQIQSPDLLGGIQPQNLNFASVLGGDTFGFLGPGNPPLEGVMPQGQTQMPAASPGGQPGAFSPAGVMLGDLFARANQNSGPTTPYQERQFQARKNVAPMKQQAGALSGAPMGIQGLT